LFDLFGDGFYTTLVKTTTTHHREEAPSTEFHQPNCTAKIVSVYSESCSIDVSMLTMDGSKPLLTWESYWILNHGGETYIGDFFSKLSIKHRRVESAEDMVDYSVPGEDSNKCHECPHPPPYNANSPPGVRLSAPAGQGGAGKGGPAVPKRALGANDDDDDDGSGGDHILYSHGKPKPKTKPPYLVYINMFDELANGYLDKSGNWSDYFKTQDVVDEGGELKAPILVPNVLAYPKYYIMTKDRQRLVKPPKSICNQKRGAEFCQEALPWSGHFVFRFAGIEPTEPDDAATWEFCGITGGINEEFEFLMQEGVCVPLTSKLSAEANCEYGLETVTSMTPGANLSVEGDFTALSELVPVVGAGALLLALVVAVTAAVVGRKTMMGAAAAAGGRYHDLASSSGHASSFSSSSSAPAAGCPSQQLVVELEQVPRLSEASRFELQL
jgi:hypothetical protein